MSGEIIRRDEADNNGSAGDPHEIWYRYGGKQLGYDGNNGTLDTDYLTSIDNRQRTPPTNPNAFLFGSSTAVSYADFSQALNPINSYGQGSDAGSYTVRAGDTLESIAANLWGDSSLWYLIAGANGLSGPGAPGEGRTLAIPANVMSNAHNASTFKPYDPAKAIGDLSPTNPKPSKKAGGCGMIGQIIMMVVAVAVTAWIAPWATAFVGAHIAGLGAIGAAVVGGAIAGAAGAIASQAVGIGIGAQSGFNWKGVGLAAIAGGISGGLAKFGSLAQAGKIGTSVVKVAGTVTKTTSALGKIGMFLGGSGFVSGAARGVLSNVLGQGIGVATGLQDKFDWAGVAAAGLGGGVSSWVSGRLGPLARTGFDAHMVGAMSSAASGIANAGVRTLIDGSDFGDNLIAALPDVIGSTIGNMIGEAILARMTEPEVYITAAGPGDPTSGATPPAPPTSNSQEDQPVPLPASITAEDLRYYREHNLNDVRADRDDERQGSEAWNRLNEQVLRLERVDAGVRVAVRGTWVWLHVRDQPPRAYQIRGYSQGDRVEEFDRPVDVAIDGMAMAFQIARVTHDSYERGGTIERLPNGHFTYRDLVMGARLRHDIHVGHETVGKGTPYIPNVPPAHNPNAVGYFHIHPGATNLTADNAGFSPGDRAGYQRVGLPHGYVAYVAGNDGSLWEFRPNRPDEHNSMGFQENRLERRGFFRVTPTIALPTGMHHEPI